MGDVHFLLSQALAVLAHLLFFLHFPSPRSTLVLTPLFLRRPGWEGHGPRPPDPACPCARIPARVRFRGGEDRKSFGSLPGLVSRSAAMSLLPECVSRPTERALVLSGRDPVLGLAQLLGGGDVPRGQPLRSPSLRASVGVTRALSWARLARIPQRRTPRLVEMPSSASV